MFPPTISSRPTKRSLRELVRGAMDTALEFATLGEATTPRPPPRPSTRIADVSIVTSAYAVPEWAGRAHRSAARHSPGGSGPDHPPPGARSGRTGAPGGRPTSELTACGPPPGGPRACDAALMLTGRTADGWR